MHLTSNYQLIAFFALTGIMLVVAAKVRPRRLEAARARQAAHARDIPPEERNEKDDEVLRLLLAGEKIKAIKSYRKFYQTGLKEAKDAVELREKTNA